MAQYRVVEKSFINNTIVEPGEIVEYDGPVSDNLEPLDGATGDARKAKGDDDKAKADTRDVKKDGPLA